MKFCKASGCDTPVFGKGYCKAHQYMREDFDSRTIVQRAVDKHRASKETDKVKSEIDESRSNLIDELDWVVSRIVRISAAGVDGYLNCYTCNTRLHFSMAQCSHFIKRGHLGLRWDFRNLVAACKDCNERLDGNLKVYAERLEKENRGIVELLNEIARDIAKPHNHELKQLLIEMRVRLKTVESKLKK